MTNLKALSALMVLMIPLTSWAWGRRGHETVGVAATYLAAQEKGAGPLKGHSFDIGSYCNVPDILWKRPETYGTEKAQHFMDLEIFNREFKKHPEIKEPFALSRQEFEKAFPEIKADAGRAYWRIREFDDRLNEIGKKLREQKEQSGKEHRGLQEQWMIQAGLLCHYVGDLSMPLHVSENYDGLLTNQKGIHSFFEDTCVDEMYPKLSARVYSKASAQWKAFVAKNKDKSALQMLEALAASSSKEIKTLLATDKANSRAQPNKTCAKFENLATDRMAQSALVLAELYRRSLGWEFDDNRFFFFKENVPYIQPGK